MSSQIKRKQSTDKNTLAKMVVEYLTENPEKKYTAIQIAKWVHSTYSDWCTRKKNRSQLSGIPLNNKAELIDKIAVDIGSQRLPIQKKNPKIKTIEVSPRKYYYTDESDVEEADSAEGISQIATDLDKSDSHSEEMLYPILGEFLSSEFGICSNFIRHQTDGGSPVKGWNEWLHPDLVGIENLSGKWSEEIKGCVEKRSNKMARLWSFEVKKSINKGNVRRFFFQAVSNSSWANFGYLAASGALDEAILLRLRMLSSLHGIGFISLNVENPSESQIIIPARERSEVDWNASNALTVNGDFKEYLKLVKAFYQSPKIDLDDWDYPSEKE